MQFKLQLEGTGTGRAMIHIRWADGVISEGRTNLHSIVIFERPPLAPEAAQGEVFIEGNLIYSGPISDSQFIYVNLYNDNNTLAHPAD